MKKITALILATIFMINGIALMCVPASAEGLDDHLVLHYDFQGDTMDEVLADKATTGVADDLGAYLSDTSLSDVLSFKNGTITNDGTKSNSSVQAVTSADIKSISQRTATVFIRFRVKDLVNGANIFNMRTTFTNASSGLSLFVNPEGRLYSNSYWNSSKKVQNYFYTSNVVEAGKYVNVALAISPVEGQTYASITAYYAFGEPTQTSDWYTSDAFNVNVANTGTSSNPFSLFAMPNDLSVTNSIAVDTVTYDDIRIYNKTLTLDEVASIFTDNSFDTIHTVGIQKKVGSVAGTTDVRFLAITDYLEANNVGFKVEASYKDDGVLKTTREAKFYETSTVYRSVTAMGTPVTAEEMGGKYIVALVIEGISDSYTDVTFTITPYRSYGDAKIYGETVTVALEDIQA